MENGVSLPKNSRVRAVDALRGIVIAAMVVANNPGDWGVLYAPEGTFWSVVFWHLRHADWHGFTPTDFVFPAFLFLSGVSCCFSFARRAETGARLRKIAVRSLEIFLLGVFLVNFPFSDGAGVPFHLPFGEWRIMGVLQRIAIAWGLGALCVTLWEKRPRAIALVVGVLLVGYWIALALGGVPGEDPFALYCHLGHRVDLALLGESHLWPLPSPRYEPEGLLGCLPATATMLFGWFAGRAIRNRVPGPGSWTPVLARFFRASLLLCAGGLAWSLVFPINKALWSSSYVLLSAGVSLFLLSLSIWLFEELSCPRLLTFLSVFGCNATLLYALDAVWVKCSWAIPSPGEGAAFSEWLYRSVCAAIAGPQGGSLLYPLLHVAFYWLLLLPLFRKKIFLKL